MVEKLKLTLRPIPWSLVTKAVAFGVTWLFFPFWLFLVVNIYLYLHRPLRVFKFLVPFFVLLVAISPWITQKSLGMALVGAAVFFLVLGVKDLFFLKRRINYEVAVLILIFLLFLGFFGNFKEWLGVGSVIASFFLFFLLYGLIFGLFKYDLEEEFDGLKPDKRVKTIVFSFTFFIWQMGWVYLFLPLGYFYQTALAFLVAAVLIGILSAHLKGALTPKRVLLGFSTFFVFTVLILAGVNWSV